MIGSDMAWNFLNCVGSIIGQGLGLQDIPPVQHVNNGEVYSCVEYIENRHEAYSVSDNCYSGWDQFHVASITSNLVSMAIATWRRSGSKYGVVAERVGCS